MTSFARVILKKIIVIPLLIIAGLFGVAYFFWPQKSKIETVTVKRGSIIQEVIVTGKIKPLESVNLAFEKSGKVQKVFAAIGDIVRAGQVLTELDTSELNADLLQAEAAIAVKRAKLNEFKRGSRPEAIRIQEVKVANAQIAIDDAKQNLTDKLRDGFTKSDDAVRNLIDQLFNNPRSVNPQIIITGFYEKTAVENRRFVIEQVLNDWTKLLYLMSNSKNPEEYILQTKQNINEIINFVDLMALGVNSLSAGSGLSQTAVDGYKSDISTARANLNTAITNLSSAEEKFRSAKAALTLEQNELLLERAGFSAEEIAAQTAEVKEAEAKAVGIRAQLEKTILRSPIDGVVIKQDAKQGEITAANAAIASVISAEKLEIEVLVPEVDIGKIAIGNLVEITLDVFPGENFKGRVFYIEPGENIVDGVVSFKVFIRFDSDDARFKSGLTANLSIETLRRDGVLILPQFAIVETDAGVFVRKINGKNTVDIPATIGLRSKNGMVEMLSGVTEGEAVVNVGIKEID